MKNTKRQKLIIIAGPTAAGKSRLAVMLAKRIGSEVISADSIQVYKYMDIGSAKITKDEMQGVKHYLVDEIDPLEKYDVTRFKASADKALKKIWAKGMIPIVAGGTGFYIQALVKNLEFGEESSPDEEYRNGLMKKAAEMGNAYIHDMLKKVDYKAALDIHENNVKRVIRALEYNHATGLKISDLNNEQQETESPYELFYFVITREREHLYEDINKRVDKMMEKGLLDEVKMLKEHGVSKNMTSMQGLGYKEIFDYLYSDGQSCEDAESLGKTVEKIKQDTRHFAKRQLTWFRHTPGCIFINRDEIKSDEEILDFMCKCIYDSTVSLI